MMRADLTKAYNAGFRWRPLAETVTDTAAFIDAVSGVEKSANDRFKCQRPRPPIVRA